MLPSFNPHGVLIPPHLVCFQKLQVYCRWGTSLRILYEVDLVWDFKHTSEDRFSHLIEETKKADGMRISDSSYSVLELFVSNNNTSARILTKLYVWRIYKIINVMHSKRRPENRESYWFWVKFLDSLNIALIFQLGRPLKAEKESTGK